MGLITAELKGLFLPQKHAVGAGSMENAVLKDQGICYDLNDLV
jgi:hypothetical protein